MPCNLVDGWIKEGEEKGEQRGEKRGFELGKIETARRMLEHGMDVALIAELPEERVRRLAAQSSPQ